MKNKKTIAKERNWVLVFVSSLLILFGLAFLLLAVTNSTSFGWWSLLIGLGGLTLTSTAVVAIIKNDPAWILLDLVLPG